MILYFPVQTHTLEIFGSQVIGQDAAIQSAGKFL